MGNSKENQTVIDLRIAVTL